MKNKKVDFHSSYCRGWEKTLVEEIIGERNPVLQVFGRN